MKDEDIDFSDLPEATDEMFARGVVRPPLSKTEPREQLTVMIDRDVFKWFKGLGPGYSGIINFVLRRYMQERLRKPQPKARRA